MAMTINGTNGVTFNDGTSMATGQQACKAWVDFNGTATVAIRASYNVSSITDNGTGDYTVNFTNAMADANYSTVIGRETLAATSYGFAGTVLGSKNSSQCRINTLNTAGTGSDLSNISLSVFR